MTHGILFLPFHAPSLLEMLPIAQRLLEEGCYRPVFFIYRDIPVAYLDDLRQKGFDVIGPKAFVHSPEARIDSPEPPEPAVVSQKSGHKTWVQKGLSVFVISFLWYLIKHGGQILSATKILRQENIKLLVLVGDRHVGWETAFVKVANRHGIPSLIVPFAISHPDSDVENRLRGADATAYLVRSWSDRLFKRVFPDWICESEGNQLFFTPPSIALAAKIWGMMPTNPWAIGGGAATRMTVESPKLKRNFEQQGIPVEKMIVTGKPSIDQIFKTFRAVDREQVRAELKIPDGKPVVLCSVPQLGEHGLLPWDRHWKEIEFLFATLARQEQACVVLSLHPKSKVSDYRTLIEKYNLILAERRIYELLPVCDLFVATFSSVVMQAIGMGKPSVVVDFYGLGYQVYDDEPGVVVLRDPDRLHPTLDKILRDRPYYQELQTAQLQRAPEWILLDGKSIDRLLNIIYELIDKKM